MEKKFRCIIVAEGEIDEVFSFTTEEERSAFAEGVHVGGDLYGAGSCQVYNEDEMVDLLTDHGESEHIRAVVAFQHHKD